MRSAIFSIVSSIIITLLMGHPTAAPTDAGKARTQQVESWPGREWPRSTPESQGVDSEQLARLLQWAADPDVNIHHVTLIRHGEVYLSVDFYPYESSIPHDLASVTKSITSTLIGIAIDRGLIADVDARVLEFFPEHSAASDGRWQRLTVRHLLTMTSGLCRDFVEGEGQLEAMRRSANWVAFVLSQPLVDEPGERFAYCSCASQLLSAIVSRASGMSALAFARANLFDPLGIGRVYWPEDPQGNNTGWGDLHMLPLDLARVGYLFLRRGEWNGRRILSESWVAQATIAQVWEGDTGYGYRWWIPVSPPGLYEGRGRGGQRLAVWPAAGLVAVLYGSGFDPGRVGAIVLPAIRSDSPLPPDTAAHRRLLAAAAAAARPPAPQPAPPLPAMAGELSGEPFVLDSNPLGLRSFTLWFDGGDEARLRLVEDDGEEENRIGLDGVYRGSPTSRFGLPAWVRGGWISQNEFAIEYNEAADNHLYLIVIEFNRGDGALFRVRENTGTVDAVISARRVG